MEIRYGANPCDFKSYATREIREEFLIEDLYQADKLTAVYSHVDRVLVMGCMPVNEAVPLDKDIDVWKCFGTKYVLERREAGFLNIGGAGAVTVDGERFELNEKDCLYVPMGSASVAMESADKANPARFYIISAPAHCRYAAKLVRLKDALVSHAGSADKSSVRTIYGYMPGEGMETCQLSMGITILEKGNVWMTMPAHTHERRMEVYSYIDLPDGDVVFHLMGKGDETRHLVMKDQQAVISPSWSIHSGVGTSAFTLIWAMAGENQVYNDKDEIPIGDMR